MGRADEGGRRVATVATHRQNDSSPGHHGEALRVRLVSCLGTVVVLCILLLGLRSTPSARSEFDLSLVGWVALAFVASLTTISIGDRDPVLSMDLPVLLACAFVRGPWIGGLVAFAGAVDINEIRGSISPSRAAWNHAQVSLSVMAAGLVFVGLGGEVGEWPLALACATGALAADVLVNYVSVALMLSLAAKRSFGSVIASMRIGDPLRFGVTYAGFGLTSVLMAEVYAAVGFLGVIVFSAPLLLGREAFRQTKRAQSIEQDLSARRDALRHVDERIADEREDERSRIAESLHDDVLQSLFDVTIRAHVLRECYRSGRLLELEGEVPALISASERAADELRDVIAGLRKSRIGHAGLVDTLTLLISHLRNESNMRFVSDLDTSLIAPAELELVIYQVAREAMLNALKHSSATTVWVSLRRREGRIALEILDDGRGFDPLEHHEKHFGLVLLQERVAMVQGTVEISSQRESGVRITALFPLGQGWSPPA
jgi:signal transduction histidine kinase